MIRRSTERGDGVGVRVCTGCVRCPAKSKISEQIGKKLDQIRKNNRADICFYIFPSFHVSAYAIHDKIRIFRSPDLRGPEGILSHLESVGS